MLDGLQYVIAQIVAIVTLAAVLAGILGWLIGRASGKRRAEKAAASPASRLTAPPVRTSDSYAPRRGIDVGVPVAEEALAPVAPSSIPYVTEPGAPVITEMPGAQAIEPSSPVEEPVVEPVVEHAPPLPSATVAGPADADVDDDPDRTVLRPAPGMTSPSKTTPYTPDRTVLRPAPGTTSPSKTTPYTPPRFTVVASTPIEGELVRRTVSVQEVQELRRALRAKELELGKLEAGALSAWDRTVPWLEAQISALMDENASLRRQIREAEEHSDADALTVERLRSLVAERDTRLAEIRAQS